MLIQPIQLTVIQWPALPVTLPPSTRGQAALCVRCRERACLVNCARRRRGHWVKEKVVKEEEEAPLSL